ncbi:hypothetical protein SKAU_G00420140 [Synaphobranchus kaupii]|uniref:Uncharacterized protein n=1 Tax=Synaphobranchus kaupii TaxID=118154 RepID=A0A9Q1I964_SYNKA|nr:hypothetical protein SKAU_G00420140 [Synaphobranchus kaupii]
MRDGDSDRSVNWAWHRRTRRQVGQVYEEADDGDVVKRRRIGCGKGSLSPLGLISGPSTGHFSPQKLHSVEERNPKLSPLSPHREARPSPSLQPSPAWGPL